jgi:hypothetical protein
MSKTIHYFELELLAIFAWRLQLDALQPPMNPNAMTLNSGALIVMPRPDIEVPSPTHDAIEASLFAEVNIPYRPEGKDFGVTYTFHIFGLPNAAPALTEMPILKHYIGHIHHRYFDKAFYRGELDIDDKETTEQ